MLPAMKRSHLAVVGAAMLLCLGWLFYRGLLSTILIPSAENLHRLVHHGQPTTNTADVDVRADEERRHMVKFLERRFSNSVTPIIHQSWKSRQLPTKRAERWSASWRTCFPDYEWRLWTDEDNLALVREHYPWFLPVYLGYQQPVERADLARYFYMFHFGGIYTDLDTICLKNFTHLLQQAPLIFGGMDSPGNDPVLHTYVQNSFFASKPGHPYWMRLISRVMLYHHQGKKGRPEYLTGPFVLMDELREYVQSNPGDVKIHPGKVFNPFSWWVNKVAACKDLGRMTDKDEEACIKSFPDAYVIQLHTQSWLKGKM